jgi:hypothetical protein
VVSRQPNPPSAFRTQKQYVGAAKLPPQTVKGLGAGEAVAGPASLRQAAAAATGEQVSPAAQHSSSPTRLKHGLRPSAQEHLPFFLPLFF